MEKYSDKELNLPCTKEDKVSHTVEEKLWDDSKREGHHFTQGERGAAAETTRVKLQRPEIDHPPLPASSLQGHPLCQTAVELQGANQHLPVQDHALVVALPLQILIQTLVQVVDNLDTMM